MIKRIKTGLFNFNLTVLLTLNLFVLIAAMLGIVALLAWGCVTLGILDVDALLQPGSLVATIYSICILLGISIVIMIQRVILHPVQDMVAGMQRLAAGDFTARMETKGWIRPLELREFAAAYNTAAEELGGIELLRKDFVNNFSHEFKTPITSLGGFADLILEDEEMPSQERWEYLQIISQEAHRLAELSNSVLAMSRLEAQTILTDAAPFALDEQLRQTALMLERKWEAKKIDLVLDLDTCQYTGSEGLLKEVWLNLLDNAIKFSPAGGKVTVRLRSAPGTVSVTVKDHGPGMDAATQSHIFDQFYQGDTSHKTEGNGLGLAMARKVVELHKGSIKVKSAPGRGSTFTVSLPA